MKLIDLIRPYNIHGNLKRFGNFSDGGYVLNCDFLKKTEKMYSYGVGNDYSFEKDIENYMDPYHIYLYDYSINLEKKVSSKISFQKQNLSFEKNKNSNNLFNHIKENNDENKKILLKIDIESNEIDFFTKINMKNFKNVIQMVVEFHLAYLDEKCIYLQSINNYINVYDIYSKKVEVVGEFYKKTLNILNKINEYFYCIHVHSNNSAPTTDIEGSKFPIAFECTFVNKKYINYKPFPLCNITYPIKNLDYDNKNCNQKIFLKF